MINHHKWINSLPKVKKEIIESINQLDYENSINSIPKKKFVQFCKKIYLINRYIYLWFNICVYSKK